MEKKNNVDSDYTVRYLQIRNVEERLFVTNKTVLLRETDTFLGEGNFF